MKLTYDNTVVKGVKRLVFKDGKIIVHRYNGNCYTLLKPSDNTKFEVREEDNE